MAPLVYSPKYDSTAFGLERLQPFDGRKSGVFEHPRNLLVGYYLWLASTALWAGGVLLPGSEPDHRGGVSVNEATWLACTDPRPMLEFLRAGGKASSRKFRLFAGACCRRVWHLLTEHARTAVEVVEAVADGREPLRKLGVSREGVWKEIYPGVGAAARDNARRVANTAAWCATQAGVHGPAVFSCADYVSIAVGYERSYPNLEPAKQGEKRAQSDLVRDLFGNPFRPAPVHPGWLAWDAGTVVRLARAIYDDRHLPEGGLDPARLTVLADALEEAGCTEEEILSHLRGPGPHVRGCHVLDALLGKE